MSAAKFERTDQEPELEAEQAPGSSNRLSALLYALIFILTLAGVAYASVSRTPVAYYWEFLALVIGMASIIFAWSNVADETSHKTLIWKQVLHWTAFLAAMFLLLLPDVQNMLNSDATGIATLLLLSLGTFTSGVHTRSWQFCLLGVVMAVCVPVIAWIEQTALALAIIAAIVVAAGQMIWVRYRR